MINKKNKIKQFIKFLQCPRTKESLKINKHLNCLCTTISKKCYKINKMSVALFDPTCQQGDAKIQKNHYENISKAYIDNLEYIHTKEYSKYFDEVLLKIAKKNRLGNMAEVCCGRGEAMLLFQNQYKNAVGVDISEVMLNSNLQILNNDNCILVQGNALKLPLKSNKFNSVVMLGGIHHVNQREKLFSEVYRILKPGGSLIFREPVNDFFLWKWLRAVIYRISPALDAETERPLRYTETRHQLLQAGLKLLFWETHGFIGFCLFMNSDVLVFNRIFHFVPGIRIIIKMFVKIDKILLKFPFSKGWGLQVVAMATK